ncbi:MAG: hypothetical protein HYX47_10435 [Burkholderiales bacterium]|nr:hypothetical protein [Burkholderiales bacterium]
MKLQINTGGAWRDVIRFNAADDHVCGEVLEAGATIGRIGEAQLRVFAVALGDVLMTWSPKTKEWKESQ